MNNTKKWYESKTLWIATIQGVAGILVVLESQYPTIGWTVVAKSIIDIMIRLLTDKPVQQ